MGLGSGVNVLVATHFGARSEKNVRESVHTSFLVCLIAGFLMLALGLIFARPLLELLNTRDDLIDGAELYLRIYFLGMPAAALYNYGNGVLNAIGDTKTPLIFLSAAGVLNVILDLVFVIGLGMSTDGVALASMLSQCVSAGLIVRSLMRSKEIYSLSLKEVRFHKDKAIHALSVGVPAGLQNAIFSVANLFIQAGVNSFSTVVVEGNSAAGNVDNLVYSVMNAFYIACSSFVGQNYGAGKSRRVLKSYLLTLCYSAVAAAVLGGLFLLFGHQFLSLFTSESDVIEAGLARIWVMCFSFPISATMDCTTAASRPWKGPRADDLRVPRLVRVPRGVDLHRVRPLPYDPLALYALSVLVGTHGRGGDRILFVLLSEICQAAGCVPRSGMKKSCPKGQLFFCDHTGRVCFFALVRKT